MSVDFSAIHFQGWAVRLVGCYTIPRAYRLPWSASNCLYHPTPFVGSRLINTLAHLTSSVWFIPHRPICLPKKAHTSSIEFNIEIQSSNSDTLSHSEFESCQRIKFSQLTPISSSTIKNFQRRKLS